MSATQIREELKDYIKSGDVRLLKILHSVAKEYNSEDYTKPGEPMKVSTLKSRIREAKSRIKAGQFTSQEDLEVEMEKW
ncbi:MAG: hypothetical protein IM574_09470 [Cytophagales bacterium]|jgi:hypothetical protein|nr:hypothetical protein [Cytophagales bacterium]MCA6389735.1 hypothetical protein [Cytophagales bacterium]MCA6392778.1 hypothetical protein [Cytophagales bacterium]MCA6394133.1 hypothetical protein [Cytophagales bacterium]MCA6397426.1 hypothetical protein [Cytophagales bacterium]